MFKAIFIVSVAQGIKANEFFIQFDTPEKRLISVKVSEAVAIRLAKELGIKIEKWPD